MNVFEKFRLNKVLKLSLNEIYKKYESCSPDERYNEPPRVINTPLLDEINNVLNKGVII